MKQLITGRLIGRLGEDIACRYLTLKGFFIISRNFTCRMGEVDIIAKKGRFVVFVEVKTSAMRRCAIAANYFLMVHQHEFGSYDMRMDACLVMLAPNFRTTKKASVQYIPDAFS